jgi:glutamate-5-semialdehyde dehydrogenase
MPSVKETAKAAKSAFEKSQLIPTEERNDALHAIKRELEAKKYDLLFANTEDQKVGHEFDLNCKYSILDTTEVYL